MLQCTPVIPPDLPDILFPLLSHLVQMVRLYGVVCQSPFGRLGVTAGLMAREGPLTFPAHGHWHFSKGSRMRASHPARGEKWRTWSWPKALHRPREPGVKRGLEGCTWEDGVGFRLKQHKRPERGGRKRWRVSGRQRDKQEGQVEWES